MQFSTGRSELNPYIAVVIGLLALAMYVASSGDSVTKLINAAKAETVAAVTPVATVAPTASVAPVATVAPTASVASVSSTPAPTTTPSVATSSTTPMSPFVSVKKPETVVATPESPGTATAVPATAATSTSTATAPSTAASSKAPSNTATSTTAASATAASTPPMSPFVSVSRPTTTSPFSRPSPPLSSVGPMVSTSATTTQSGGESVFSQPSTSQQSVVQAPAPAVSASPLAMATTATVANVAANGSMGSSLLSTILSIFIGIIVFFGLLALLSRLGGVDISAAIKRGVGAQPALYDITLAQNKIAKDIVPMPAPSAPSVVNNKEVFQVGNGNLTYIEARGACQAQGAKLANYSQIEDAYNNGAEWCSYGWSEGQMALFPTQKETYERLQEGCSGDQNSCGRPGINGGYIDNPNVRFAANCYGKKPKPTKAEIRATKQRVISPQDREAQRIAQVYKQADKQLKIRPFAPGEWSEMEDTSNVMPTADASNSQENDSPNN